MKDLAAYAYFEVKQDDGKTPLILALLKGNLQIDLAARNADLETKQDDGKIRIALAVCYCNRKS